MVLLIGSCRHSPSDHSSPLTWAIRLSCHCSSPGEPSSGESLIPGDDVPEHSVFVWSGSWN